MKNNGKKRKRGVNLGFEKFQFGLRLTCDVIAVLLAWFISYYIKFHVIEHGSELPFYQFAMFSIAAVLSTFCIMYMNKMYSVSVSTKRRTEIFTVLRCSCEEFLFIVTFYYFLYPAKVSREHLVMYFIVLSVLLAYGRIISNYIFAKRIKHGYYSQNVLLVGGGSKMNEFYEVLRSNKNTMMRVSGQYCGGNCAIKGVKQVKADNLVDAVESVSATVVVISYDPDRISEEDLIEKQALELFNQIVYVIPRIPNSYAGTVIDEMQHMPIVKLNGAGPNMCGRFIKRTFDIVSCGIGVIVLLPLYLILSVLVKLSSPGPVFFKQKRVTRDGRVFEMYKFRSMRTDMPEGTAHWTEENDPRITKIGKILRKTSLDEIPQFFNVLGGSMSLIGPRPERPELEENFKTEIAGYNMRHRMKAGISGWAQVNGLRGNTSLEKRIDYDLYYVRNWSFLFDLKIVFLTFFKGFINKNAY